MAEGIVYLDVDDEITSAAQRIRSATGTKVALVVPNGSRIATSRMNFRLLSREALVSNKRLSIVSGDAGSRSLAASAGLPVFGSVGEYETSIAQPTDPSSGTVVAGRGPVDPTPTVLAASAMAASETVVLPPEPVVIPTAPVRKSQRPRRPTPDAGDTTTIPTEPMGTAPAGTGPAGSAPVHPTRGLPRSRDDGDTAEGGAAGRPLLGGWLRAPILAAIGLVGLAAIVVAVGAYLFLPSASIRLTPRQEPIGPIPISVAADPDVTTVDIANGVVPAVRLDVPVEAAKTFTTTGKHIEETSARGSVTFTNYDTSSGVSIPSGSIVSTEGGTRFRTTRTAILQPAGILPFTPTTDSVPVVAAKTGEAWNVPANTIRVVPQGQNPDLLKVNNPDPTDGGSRTVTPEVTKAEVDAAVTAIRADLQAAFDAAVAAGAGAPGDTKLFAETAAIGAVTVDADPQGFVGKAVTTFDIRMTASGSVIAVDPGPVESIAAARLANEIKADERLVDGSVDIVVGEGSVGEDGQITFEATARATRVAIVTAASLRDLVKGRTAADARAALAPFGDAVVTLWPDWVNTVTGMDSRLEVTVVDGAGAGDPMPSASAPSTRPSATPRGSQRGPAAPASGAAVPSSSAP